MLSTGVESRTASSTDPLPNSLQDIQTTFPSQMPRFAGAFSQSSNSDLAERDLELINLARRRSIAFFRT